MSQEERRQHVHVGTGALGLGLTAWLGSLAKLSVVLANRTHEDSRTANTCLCRLRQYDLLFADSRTEPVVFSRFLFTDNDREHFVNAVADAQTVLLTTALGEGIAPSLSLLAEGLAARIKAATADRLHVVACENAIDSIGLRRAIIPSLLQMGLSESKLDEAVLFLPSVVDRLCTKLPFDSAVGRVQVLVEEFAQWIIQRPSTGTVLEEILASPANDHITFVDNLSPYLRRKKWLVNGPHLLIALNAWDLGYLQLDVFLQDRNANTLLAALLREASDIFSTLDTTFDPEELRSFSAQIHQRFRNHPDLVKRVLHRFTGPDRLEDFFKDVYRKVTDASLRYLSPLQWTGRTLMVVTRLIHEERYPPPQIK